MLIVVFKMFTKLFLLAVLCLGAYAFPEGRIVNGTDAGETEFPFAVSLRNNNRHSCGGTILNNRFVLTAAHCVPCSTGNARGLSIQYGSNRISATSERSINVKKINCNNYDANKIINDYAVLELESAIPVGNWKPVQIAKSFDGSKRHTGVIIGWGRLSTNGPIPEKLQKLTVNVYDDNTCGKKNDIRHHICFGAPNAGACFGDSGTALLIDGIQVGIASFISHNQCGVATEQYPNVYSRVANYYEWIAKTAGL